MDDPVKTPTSAIAVRNLVKHYPGVLAVNDISFDVPANQCFGLLGPNGAGKTTTLEIIEGIQTATSGTITFQGAYDYRGFKDKIGIQFQHTALQEFVSVRETLTMFRQLYDHGLAVDDLVEMCTLGEFLDRDTNKLSGGQRQRVLLALALVNDPQIIFLDEPTTGLDPQARRNFWDLVERIKKQNKTIVLTTHYMDEAAVLCDDIAIMDKGLIIAQGSPANLLQNHYGESVVQLPEEVVGDRLDGLGITCYRSNHIVEIPTKDLDETLKQLTAAGISLRQMRIRSWDLEDLFIALTGKALRG